LEPAAKVTAIDGSQQEIARGPVAYNESSGRERCRFTIAHEFGHFLLPFHGAGAQCVKADLGVLKSNKPDRAKEAAANRFAASLLMPKKIFVRDIRESGAPELEHILKFSKRYEVSKEAAARRYTDLCDHVCAIIFSHERRVRAFCKTTTFPYLDVRRDDPLPAASISAKTQGVVGRMSDWSETATETWLGTSNRLRGKFLYEQFLQRANGYRLSMLTIDDAPDIQESDEDEELEESWTPRFWR
jgi:hypothetical protein